MHFKDSEKDEYRYAAVERNTAGASKPSFKSEWSQYGNLATAERYILDWIELLNRKGKFDVRDKDCKVCKEGKCKSDPLKVSVSLPSAN